MLCVDYILFELFGLLFQKFNVDQCVFLVVLGVCLVIGDLIFGVIIMFDQLNLCFDVSILQAWLGGCVCGYVSLENWDEGVVVGLLNYNVNSYCNCSGGILQILIFVGLGMGFNVGVWYFCYDLILVIQFVSVGQLMNYYWQSIDIYV